MDRTIPVSEAVIRQAVDLMETLEFLAKVAARPHEATKAGNCADALRTALRQDQTRPCGYCGHRLVDGGPAPQCPVGWRCAHADPNALRQDVQQPVAWVDPSALRWLADQERSPNAFIETSLNVSPDDEGRRAPIYATPPAAPARQALTGDLLAACVIEAHQMCDRNPSLRWSTAFARAIERAHGITQEDSGNG